VRYFLDTEFLENGPSFPLILLSIGIVAEDGREFYVVNEDAPLELANDWVKANVIPHLGGPKVRRTNSATLVRSFIGNNSKPEFWGYYADYDWVVFCQLFGTMINLPKGWPMYCRDLKQWCDMLGNPRLPKQTSQEHNALADARWNKEVWDFLNARATADAKEGT
jgi:3'-5' exoribonuclease-like protein